MCTPTSRPSGTAASVMLDRRMARGPPPPSASNRGRIFKTLVVSVDGRFVLAVVPVDRELDLKRLAEVTGARRAEMAEPVAAERATGYVGGAIAAAITRDH